MKTEDENNQRAGDDPAALNAIVEDSSKHTACERCSASS